MRNVAPWSKHATRDGAFRRKQSEFRATIGDPEHPAEAGRYHLFVSYACPWAHRTLIHRELLGLQDSISIDVVDWHMNDDGSWSFNADEEGCTQPTILDVDNVQQIYLGSNPDFPSIGTVPILYDKVAKRIVNNESREIIRMLNDHAQALGGKDAGLAPKDLRADIDAMIDANYETINNGVYKSGFARSQEAYESAVATLFGRLEEVDAHLEGRNYLVGPGEGTLTEADVCLFVTLLRFDPVYHTHFKTNRKLIREFPNLWMHVKRIANHPGIPATIDLHHIVGHYYWSHQSINAYRVVPWHLRDDALKQLGLTSVHASLT